MGAHHEHPGWEVAMGPALAAQDGGQRVGEKLRHQVQVQLVRLDTQHKPTTNNESGERGALSACCVFVSVTRTHTHTHTHVLTHTHTHSLSLSVIGCTSCPDV